MPGNTLSGSHNVGNAVGNGATASANGATNTGSTSTVSYSAPALSAAEIEKALSLAVPGSKAYSLIGTLNVGIGGLLTAAPEVIDTVKDIIGRVRQKFGR